MDDFIQLVGPNRAVEIGGVKLVGMNAENGAKLLFTMAFIVIVLLAGRALRSLLRITLRKRANARVQFWARQGVQLSMAIVLVLGMLSVWFDDPTRLATALGLVTAGLAFALQRVVLSVAGYLVILRGNTFNVGDRITMGGVRGDVIALGFIQTTIMEMGQPPAVQNADPAMWVRGRQYSGRVVTVPNVKVFDEPVYNYTRDFPYLWEELAVPISFDADAGRAESILAEVAQRHTVQAEQMGAEALREMQRRYFMNDAGVRPRVYYRLTDSWIELSVRFVAEQWRIRETKDKMSRDILRALRDAGISVASSTFAIVGLPALHIASDARDNTPTPFPSPRDDRPAANNRAAAHAQVTAKSMLVRLKTLWTDARDSLWLIPAVLTLIAAVLAFGLVQLESSYAIDLGNGYWLIGGSVDGARAVLSTIAGSLITVTGVVFSVTIVALQLASSQFTPRILRNFMADRSNQYVLGVFIATFTYTLLVLRVVRSTDEGEPFVPQMAVSLAILLSLVSIGFLIHFIHHLARSIQAAALLEKIMDEALEQVERHFPRDVGEPEVDVPPLHDIAGRQPQSVTADRAGYLQGVDEDSLFKLGTGQELRIEMKEPIGAFLLPGQPVALIWCDEPVDDAVYRQVQAAFVVGPQRSPDQDLEYFLLEISDMAVKALSPGINDPTTAKHCIDRLTQILLALGRRRPADPLRTGSGCVHFIAKPCTFESSLGTAFDDVLHYGRGHAAILDKVRHSIALLRSLLPCQRHASLDGVEARVDQCAKP